MAYLRNNSRAVLATIKRDGQPQMSLVDYGVDSDGLIRIQVTQPAAKTKNIRRDPRVSLTVIGDNWYQYIVVEGRAGLLEDDPLPVLRETYELIGGKPHPDWDEFNRAMLDEQQVVMTMSIDRLYPLDQ
ncbi:MAG: PPOX class F420-dependent oxidoreductase [Sphaerobacteraceae bacterium]|nr:MAG: PPOX class F420-dependent oxidoreductase [Sphaerobacteraceae bacterium]